MLTCFAFLALTVFRTGAEAEVSEVFAEEGSEAVLPCKHDSSYNSVAITWSKANQGTVWRKQRSGLQYWAAGWTLKGSQESRVQCPHTKFENGDYSLQIRELTEADGGVYTCNVERGSQVIEKVVSLRIMKVTVSPSVPMVGRFFHMSCKVTPWPYGASVQWTLNNTPFRTLVKRPDDKNPAYILRERATDSLSGSWSCVVRFRGSEGRVSASVAVKGIIEPSDNNTKVYAAVGSAVVLPCVFSSDLIPSSPAWDKQNPGFYNSAPGRLPASFSTASPSSQTPWDQSASAKEVAFDDEGRYRCSGIVHGHKQIRTMQLVVAKIESKVSAKKKGPLTLTCVLSDLSEVIGYEWVHVTYDLNGTQSVKAVQKGKNPSIKVSEETQGEWTCRFYDREGILGNVTHHIQLMSGLSGKKSAAPSYNTAAVVGLGFLLLVLLLVLAQMYKNHQRRKRIHQYPALETIIHNVSNEREEREKSRVKK